MTERETRPGSQPPSQPQQSVVSGRVCVAFQELAGGRREVLIEFNGQIYTLRATRNGRLILNK